MVSTMAFSSKGYEFGFRVYFDKGSPNKAIFGIFELFYKPINKRIQGLKKFPLLHAQFKTVCKGNIKF